MTIGILVSVAIFMVGVIFSAGRLSARVDKLEDLARDFKADLSRFHDQLDNIRDLLARQPAR